MKKVSIGCAMKFERRQDERDDIYGGARLSEQPLRALGERLRHLGLHMYYCEQYSYFARAVLCIQSVLTHDLFKSV